ncbi:adenosine deaminase [Lyngbya confervoides]|uniref:Adenine deaminase n=1 Tax=Lyngbya confervoides BDU141951 TaxID=1574623 RepID=A0ABD4T5S9_9CYAN|nr:adenosine deaminase [Lyngbya confervoides]MCM1983835.1 adenosine deaminase [Lyngbya confervoides BDU141951]
MNEFILKVPKVELHLHIEGTLEPEMMWMLGDRNQIQLPYPSVDAIRRAYRFQDLQSFLEVYYAGMSVLQTEQDFYDLTWAYLQKAQQQTIRHVELFFDPQAHTQRGIPFPVVYYGIHQALQEAQKQYGLSSQLILCFLRDRPPASALQTLEQALPYRAGIRAVGLDSAERDYPPSHFRFVFERARREGFLTVAHAGEEGPPSYIWEAIQLLRVSRIDHGVRCIEDPQLLAYLQQTQIPLTVCPLSNVKLRVFDQMADHNLKTLLDLGIAVTINSDDPAYFGGYLGENLEAAQTALHLSQAEIVQLLKNAIEAAFVSAQRRTDLLTELESFVAQSGPVPSETPWSES